MIQDKFAQFLSVVFQPVFVPIYSVLIVFNSDTHLAFVVAPAIQTFIYIVLMLNMVVLPLISLFYFKKKGIITDLYIRDAKERFMPFMMVLAFHASTYYLFQMDDLNLPSVIPNMILGGAIGISICMAINVKWKISIHMLGMGCIVGLLVGLTMRYQSALLPIILSIILISGLVGYARLRLDAHTSGQVYAGFTLGVLVMIGTVLVG
ncbi:MAG: putative membrane protein (Fun14 family) [Granulosicoccus sp.]|jgi:uncharacterized membrane protein (Fun14 family)